MAEGFISIRLALSRIVASGKKIGAAGNKNKNERRPIEGFRRLAIGHGIFWFLIGGHSLKVKLPKKRPRFPEALHFDW